MAPYSHDFHDSQIRNQAAAAATPPQLPRKCIFRLPSPPRRDVEFERRWREGFVDACALCNKKIHDNQNRYMYGDLQAFCSIGCRDCQITKDELLKPPSANRSLRGISSIRSVLKKKFNK